MHIALLGYNSINNISFSKHKKCTNNKSRYVYLLIDSTNSFGRNGASEAAVLYNKDAQLSLQCCRVSLFQLSNISHGGFRPCEVICPIKLIDVKSYKNYPDVKRFSKHTNMSIKSTTWRKPLYEDY